MTIAVDFTTSDVNGNVHNLFNYLDNNKYVLLDFFFTRCSACQTSSPQCNASYIYFGCNQGDVIFLGIDYYDSRQDVINFINQYGLDYPCISGDDGGRQICEMYGIDAFPTYILIAPNKNIVERDIWPFSTNICNSILQSYGLQTMSCQENINDFYDENISIYPIPAKDEILLGFYNYYLNEPIIFIYDLTGKMIYTEIITNLSNTHKMDISAIDNVYFY